MEAIAYNSIKLSTMNSFDFVTDPLYLMLLNESYTPDIDTHSVIGDVSGDEITGTGYVAGGKEIANLVATQDNTNDWALLSGDPVIWTTSTLTARYGAVYQNIGSFLLVFYVDFDINRSVLAANLIVGFGQGVLRIQ